MQVIENGSVNKLSEELKKECIFPITGEYAEYQLLNGQPIYDEKQRRWRKVFGQSRTILLRDRIKDPFQRKDKEGNWVEGYVNIGLPALNGIDERSGFVTRFKKFSVDAPSLTEPGDGNFKLYKGNLEHEEINEILCLLNCNTSFKYRDPGAPEVFKRIDRVAESKNITDILAKKGEALIFASKMSNEDVYEFAASKNWSVNEEPGIIKARISKYAEEYPENFLNDANDETKKVKSMLKLAMDKGIWKFDSTENMAIWGNTGEPFAVLEEVNGWTPVDCLCFWIDTNTNGKKVLSGIEKQYKSLNKDKTVITG